MRTCVTAALYRSTQSDSSMVYHAYTLGFEDDKERKVSLDLFDAWAKTNLKGYEPVAEAKPDEP